MTQPADFTDDVVWGLKAIAAVIGRNESQTHYMLKTGQLPARQIGHKWVASRSELRRALFGDAAA